MPMGVLPVASPSTACPPPRRRSLIISAMRLAIVRAISSYSTMTTGTRSLEDGIQWEEGGCLKDKASGAITHFRRRNRQSFSGPGLGPENVPNRGIFGPEHPDGESAQSISPREIQFLLEAARVFEEQPLVNSAIGEVGERRSGDAVPLNHCPVSLGEAQA